MHSISNRSRGLDSTGSILRKYKPDTGTFHCLKPLIRGLLIENFVAKWSWMRRFADWLGFCPLLGNVNERAPSHKATFEESVIRWLPLCLLNCSRLSAPCGTPCHLQGATRRKYWSFYLCVYASTFFFWSVLKKEFKTDILTLFCHISFYFQGVLNFYFTITYFGTYRLKISKVYTSDATFYKTRGKHGTLVSRSCRLDIFKLLFCVSSWNAQNMYEVLSRSSEDGQLHDPRFMAYIKHGAAKSRSCGWYRLNTGSLK